MLTTRKSLNPKMQEILEVAKNHLLGKDQALVIAFVSVLSGGHLLIEDIPGVGKTTLVYILAQAFGLDVSRIQFTNDLLPTDIVGVSIFNRQNDRFEFIKGPIFGELVLADELNRATPKTQSALLQAMEEGKASVDGVEHELDPHFLVVATQNPLQQVGTYPLPESQLDRFFMSLELGLPDRGHEKEILHMQKGREHIKKMPRLMESGDLSKAQKEIETIHVSEELTDYVLDLLETGRRELSQGKALSLRSGKDLIRAVKTHAWIYSRDFALPDDVQTLVPHVWGHRLGGAKGIRYGQELATELVQKVQVHS